MDAEERKKNHRKQMKETGKYRKPREKKKQKSQRVIERKE